MKVNTFAIRSEDYATSRPKYPMSLFTWLTENSSRHDVAWDCATGNGQAAIGVAQFFSIVYATDISKEQIDNAIKNDRITYSVSSAEESNLSSSSVDLVTAAQSLHWFNYSRYWNEVRRVARDGALFAAWGYDWVSSTPEVNENLIKPFREVISPFWSSKNQILWRGYVEEEIKFPFTKIYMPKFEINDQWPLINLINYFRTWSACKLADTEAQKELVGIVENIIQLVGSNTIIPITMPLKTIAGLIE